MKRIIAIVGCVCLLFAFTACGGNAEVEEALSAKTWHADRYDDNSHMLAYEYEFKDGKVNVSYIDITEASSISPTITNEDSLNVVNIGECDYKITDSTIEISGDYETTLNYEMVDGVLTIDEGNCFTNDFIKTKLKGVWKNDMVNALLGTQVTTITEKKYDGQGGFELSTVMTGISSASINTTGTYEVHNGFILEKGDNGENRRYFFIYDGDDISFENIDLVREN